jgi:lipid-binding SYLF domain-containing protein
VKQKLFIATAVLALAATTPSPARAEGLQAEVDQAAVVIDRFREMPEKSIPEAVLRDAKGLAILTVLKAGFVFSGQGGWGVVVARTPHGWSGPSAIGTGGAGFGFQVGAQVTEFVIVLNTPEAVDAFARDANIALGADLSAAAGPIGRNVAANVMPVAAVYTYSRTQGLFAGASLEGTVIATRDDANKKYYGHPVSPKDILSGKVKPPAGATKLTQALRPYNRTDRASASSGLTPAGLAESCNVIPVDEVSDLQPFSFGRGAGARAPARRTGTCNSRQALRSEARLAASEAWKISYERT